MSDSGVAQRLKIFIEEKGLTNSQFADSCGIPRPSLSQLLTGRNKKINDNMIGQIHSAFPNLSVIWLLFGEGEMEENPQIGTLTSPNVEEVTDLDMGLFSFVDDGEMSGSKKIVFAQDDTQRRQNLQGEGLKNGEIKSQQSDYKAEKLQEKVKELNLKIENLVKNPRKVLSIMVYYDDNTFETFFPSK